MLAMKWNLKNCTENSLINIKKAGAKEMLMNQESSGSWMNFQVDVIFEDWSGKNAWNDFFNTEEGQDFGQRINNVAKIIDREYFLTVDY